MAYASLLVHRRRELHRLIGLAIEEVYAERIAEHYEVQAWPWPSASRISASRALAMTVLSG